MDEKAKEGLREGLRKAQSTRVLHPLEGTSSVTYERDKGYWRARVFILGDRIFNKTHLSSARQGYLLAGEAMSYLGELMHESEY